MDEKKSKVIRILNELVGIFKARKTIVKIFKAKDIKAAYEAEKAALSNELKVFRETMLSFINKAQYPISTISVVSEQGVISKDNLVEIALILLMSGVLDDSELTDDEGSIGDTLECGSEDLQELLDRLFRIYL